MGMRLGEIDGSAADAGMPEGIPDGSLAVTRPCAPDAPPRVPRGSTPIGCEVVSPGDHDGDGFDNEIDCDDCSPQINPGAYDFPGNGIDEDCDGVDDRACDDSRLSIEPGSALEAARAIGLCQPATEAGRGWGVLSARFTTADGVGEPADGQVGVLPGLGVNRPFDGEAVLALSTSLARDPPDASSFCRNHGQTGGFPPGFPVEARACPGVVSGTPWDPVALEVRLRVPTNVRGLAFASAFFTHEYPDFVCSPFNDVFAVFQERATGLENIVFDSEGSPITVNTVLLSVCRPHTHDDRDFPCVQGSESLEGTGFDVGCPFFDRRIRSQAGASTGCLETLSRAAPGSITTLRFALWDSGDGELDSLALIDGFGWIPEDVEVVSP